MLAAPVLLVLAAKAKVKAYGKKVTCSSFVVVFYLGPPKTPTAAASSFARSSSGSTAPRPFCLFWLLFFGGGRGKQAARARARVHTQRADETPPTIKNTHLIQRVAQQQEQRGRRAARGPAPRVLRKVLVALGAGAVAGGAQQRGEHRRSRPAAKAVLLGAQRWVIVFVLWVCLLVWLVVY